MIAQTKCISLLLRGLVICPLLMMLPGTALAHGGDEVAKVMVAGYQVTLVFAEQATADQNLVHLQILDEKGVPVQNAQVDISAMPVATMSSHRDHMDGDSQDMSDMGSMHGMHGMNPKRGAVSVKEIAGEYVGVITFPAAGHWLLNAHFNVNGQMFTAEFPVEVAAGTSAFAMVILASFVALNAFIIWLASFTKRNPVSA